MDSVFKHKPLKPVFRYTVSFQADLSRDQEFKLEALSAIITPCQF